MTKTPRPRRSAALVFGPLYAAGGTVTVNADTLAGDGDGSITAFGGPTISVTNASPDYLVFDAITIPFLPGGEVLFTGAAGQTAATKAGIKLTQSGQGSNPVITINENYPSQVGTSSEHPRPRPGDLFERRNRQPGRTGCHHQRRRLGALN